MMTIGLRPDANGPGEPGGTSRRDAPERSVQSGAAASPALPGGDAMLRRAVSPLASNPRPETVTERRTGDDTGPAGPRPTDRRDSADMRPPRDPAGPLKSFAQIPTAVMMEISRLREERAALDAQGVPGRNDPTPMPARPDAIGATTPYDAA